MAVTYLLDTSVVTRLRVPAVRARVQALDASGLARTAMTDLEVGFSARDTAAWDRLMTALETFELVDIVPSHFTRARQVQRLLAQRGLTQGSGAAMTRSGTFLPSRASVRGPIRNLSSPLRQLPTRI